MRWQNMCESIIWVFVLIVLKDIPVTVAALTNDELLTIVTSVKRKYQNKLEQVLS